MATEVVKNTKGTTIGLLSDKDRQVEEEPKPAKKKAAKKPKK